MTMIHAVSEHTGLLTVTGRHRKPVTDELVITLQHRTTGNPRSIVLSRDQVQDLSDALTTWLSEGWPGVAKRSER